KTSLRADSHNLRNVSLVREDSNKIFPSASLLNDKTAAADKMTPIVATTGMRLGTNDNGSRPLATPSTTAVTTPTIRDSKSAAKVPCLSAEVSINLSGTHSGYAIV